MVQCFSCISDYINKLSAESKDQAIDKVLAHLPLLRVGNKKAKTEYVGLVPRLLSYSIENGAYIEECNQLLSYSIIHPALTCDERAHFKWWFKHMEERFTSGYNNQSQQKTQNWRSKLAESGGQRDAEPQTRGKWESERILYELSGLTDLWQSQSWPTNCY